MDNDSYIQFLRYCLDGAQPLPECVDSMDWKKLMVWAEKQAVVGIIFHGIERVGNAKEAGEHGGKIPFAVLMQWIGYANQIKTRNLQINRCCADIVSKLRERGIAVCILKGQGNAMMYPSPLLRTPGDIDLLVINESLGDIIKFVKTRNPHGVAQYHHIDLGLVNNIEVEVHYRATYIYHPLANRRLQKWLKQHLDIKNIALINDAGEIPVPNWEYNIVFQLTHIYNHVLHEGIGLRQMIDFYYLLQQVPNRDRAYWDKTFKCLGIRAIAGAVMWVLRVILCMKESYLIVPPDQHRGEFLYQQIIYGGNFGKWDEEKKKFGDGQIIRNILRLKRDIKLFRFFPSECLWEPFFRIYHFFWRMRYN